MRRSPTWAWWVVTGPVAGLVVLGCLAPALLIVDSFVLGRSPPDYIITFWAGGIAGFWGGLGGLVSGSVCAVIVTALRRRGHRTTEALYGAIAAGVTVVLALPVSLSTLMSAGPVSVWDTMVWLVLPLSASAITAAFVGAWIWRRTMAEKMPTPEA